MARLARAIHALLAEKLAKGVDAATSAGITEER
jgi:hypothetical protein